MIQWFPGHMMKAIREIEHMSKIADLFVVVLDARIPISSYNFEFDKIAPQKPRLFVFTKKDLADRAKIAIIMKKFQEKYPNSLFVNLKNKSDINTIYRKMEALLKPKRERDARKGLLKSRLRAIVIGIPNAGKSTLINSLAKKKVTKTGNKPGITRGQQWISLPRVQLLDTPGILWPRFDNELTAIKLAMVGSIKYEILNKEDFLFRALRIISKKYPEKLKQFNMEELNTVEIAHKEVIEFAKRKNFLTKNKEMDWNKTINYLVNYIRDLRGVTYDD